MKLTTTLWNNHVYMICLICEVGVSWKHCSLFYAVFANPFYSDDEKQISLDQCFDISFVIHKSATNFLYKVEEKRTKSSSVSLLRITTLLSKYILSIQILERWCLMVSEINV